MIESKIDEVEKLLNRATDSGELGIPAMLEAVTALATALEPLERVLVAAALITASDSGELDIPAMLEAVTALATAPSPWERDLKGAKND